MSYCGPKKLIVPRSWIYIEENLSCFIHDLMYQEIGDKAYWNFNEADEMLIQNLRTLPNKSIIGWIALGIFLFKRIVCPLLK